MKWLLYMLCGICWLFVGTGCGLLLLAYVITSATNSGLQGQFPFLFISAFNLSQGAVDFVHIASFLLFTAFCLLIGLGLCSHGLALRDEKGQSKA